MGSAIKEVMCKNKWDGASPIFIVARFRSGSTMLWQLFDAVEKFMAFYEPYHDEVIPYTHKVEHSKEELNHKIKRSNPFYHYKKADLSLHSPEFAYKNLYISPSGKYKKLEKWTNHLIELAYSNGKIPVLQFNRADFRIQWLKRKFGAYTIYLVRNPRDHYYSILKANHIEPPPNIGSMTREEWITNPYIAFRPYAHHLFFTRMWRVLLSKEFPFLINHRFQSSYGVVYCIWKLSFLLGLRTADLVLGFEEDFGTAPYKGIDKLQSAGLVSLKDRPKLTELVKPPQLGKYRELGLEDGWYESQERECDKMLKYLGLTLFLGRLPLPLIKILHWPFWKKVGKPRFKEFFEAFYTKQTELYIPQLTEDFSKQPE